MVGHQARSLELVERVIREGDVSERQGHHALGAVESIHQFLHLVQLCLRLNPAAAFALGISQHAMHVQRVVAKPQDERCAKALGSLFLELQFIERHTQAVVGLGVVHLARQGLHEGLDGALVVSQVEQGVGVGVPVIESIPSRLGHRIQVGQDVLVALHAVECRHAQGLSDLVLRVDEQGAIGQRQSLLMLATLERGTRCVDQVEPVLGRDRQGHFESSQGITPLALATQGHTSLPGLVGPLELSGNSGSGGDLHGCTLACE